jgi:carbamoyltransferase
MIVLGFGGSGHDWSSCATDGTRLVALDEERLARKKYGVGADLLAGLSRRTCLAALGAAAGDVTHAVACELVPRHFYYPFRDRMTVINHHLAHAYSAFPASGFTEAAVLVTDNSGSLVRGDKTGGGFREAETITFFQAGRDGIKVIDKVVGQHYLEDGSGSGYYQPGVTDNSLGHFYRAASLAIGLAYLAPSAKYPVSEDGKTMGLAPYGDKRFVDDVLDLVTLLPGGGVRIDARQVSSTFAKLVESGSFEDKAALARAAQEVLETALLHCARALAERTGARDLCIAGGVGLNSVANGRILRETDFERVFIVPAAGDNGISLGCAYYGLHQFGGVPFDAMPSIANAYLGPDYPASRIAGALAEAGFSASAPDDLPSRVAGLLADGKLVGWFDGGSEFGPRALGHRSILSAPFPASVRDHLNDNVKFREWFRPYAPIIAEHRAAEHFDVSQPSPYMLIVAGVKQPARMPAITHVDGTARLQTIDQASNPRIFATLAAFEDLTGCPVLLNTSFNVAGQPIVETPQDAISAFAGMNLDYLVMGERLVGK